MEIVLILLLLPCTPHVVVVVVVVCVCVCVCVCACVRAHSEWMGVLDGGVVPHLHVKQPYSVQETAQVIIHFL